MTEQEFNQAVSDGKVTVLDPQTPENPNPAPEPFNEYEPILNRLRSPKRALTAVPTFVPQTFEESIQYVDDGLTKKPYFYINGEWVSYDITTGIAFDNAGVVTASGGSTQTTSFTITGVDPILFIAISGNSGDAPTAVTWDGIALTLVDSTTTSGGYICYLYYLRGASSGTKTVSITMSGSHGADAIAVSYVRTNQASQLDTSAKSGPTTTTHYTQSITTGVDNAWAVMAGVYGGSTITADSGTVIRKIAGSELYFCDSGVAKSPAGSLTLGLTSSSQAFTGVIASFKPN